MKERYEWLAANWKAGLAFIYSLVVIFDFIVVPSWIGLHRPDLFLVLKAVAGLSNEMQQLTMQIAFRNHEPFTLQGGGMIHLAFGALLTGAAVTKDQLLIAREQNKGTTNLIRSASELNPEPIKQKPSKGSGASGMRPTQSDDDDPPPPAV